MTHAFEGTLGHPVFEETGPIHFCDLNGHPLFDAEMNRFPGNRVAHFAKARCAAGDSSFFCFCHGLQMEINAP